MTSSPATNQLVATGWGSEALKSLLLQLLVLFFRQEETTDVGEMIWKFLGILPNFEILHEILVMWLYAYVFAICEYRCTRIHIQKHIYRIEDLQKQQTKYHILLFES